MHVNRSRWSDVPSLCIPLVILEFISEGSYSGNAFSMKTNISQNYSISQYSRQLIKISLAHGTLLEIFNSTPANNIRFW